MTLVRRFLIVGALLLMLPVAGYAQEATLTGTVTDSTGAVSARRHHHRRERRPPATRSTASPTNAASTGFLCA